MNNYELHEQAQELSDTNTKYEIARKCVSLEDASKEITKVLQGEKNRVKINVHLGDEEK